MNVAYKKLVAYIYCIRVQNFELDLFLLPLFVPPLNFVLIGPTGVIDTKMQMTFRCV